MDSDSICWSTHSITDIRLNPIEISLSVLEVKPEKDAKALQIITEYTNIHTHFCTSRWQVEDVA